MPWLVRFDDRFEVEFADFSAEVQDALLAAARLLEDYGPRLGRPHVDTLKGSRFPNLKELRFAAADGAWRAAFAFDPQRRAILLVAGDKSGISQDRFYAQLIRKADGRYAAHLAQSVQKPRRGT